MMNGKAEAVLARPRFWRNWLAQAWAFYFAHRPIIVLSMGLYLLLLHAAAAWLFWYSPWPGVIAWKLGLGSRWVELDQSYDRRRPLIQRLANSLDPGAVLFIGDSQLTALDIGTLADRAVQLSIPGETARRVAKRIGDYRMAVRDAKLVFIHVGTNDLRYRTPERFGRPFARILRTVLAGVPVILSGILPVNERSFRRYGNAEIRAANGTIAQACAARPGCSFVDTGAALADATGNLDPRYHDEAGLHLNSNGIRVWRAELASILDPWRSF